MTANDKRQAWLRILARVSTGDLEEIVTSCGGIPAHTVLKRPETGTVMIEGRAGGTGQRFNAGEATVTRCVMQLASGELGVSYALGSDRKRARLAAAVDAMLQLPEYASTIRPALDQLASQQQAVRDLASRKAAASKVDFFTLVRGHD
jgi:alpha-D-ribose 1-methylphosphonate 5-triphosphate synthase subunit PhnG